jgi:phenylacetate-CoA ligase
MRTSEFLRRNVFFFIDAVKGGHLQRHYKDIRHILNNYDHDLTKQLLNNYLSELLRHAINTTPFYKGISDPDLKGIPVINKNIIRDNFDLFKSNASNFYQYKSVVTSGSTGTPFSVYHDKRKRERSTADTIFFSELAGFKIGQKLYYFKIWNNINKKSRALALLQNIVAYDVLSLNDDSIESIITILKNDPSRKGLLGYASVYDSICYYLHKNNPAPIDNKTTSIIAMSEALSLSTKKVISDYFGVCAVSRYSNVENGIIAQQLMDGSNEFLINNASYYIEVLDMGHDVEAQLGTPGRIVVTDLFNYAMPLIRYDTGDIGIMAEKNVLGCQRQVLKSIEGRRMDAIYNTAGSLVSSYVITNNMWKYKEIRQYQFIQVSQKDYLFKLNGDLPFSRADELTEEFKGYFGKDANIKIEYVNGIPLLASGKRKKVMNISK